MYTRCIYFDTDIWNILLYVHKIYYPLKCTQDVLSCYMYTRCTILIKVHNMYYHEKGSHDVIFCYMYTIRNILLHVHKMYYPVTPT